MKALILAAVLACFAALVFAPAEVRKPLLITATALILILSTSYTPVVYRYSGWQNTKYVLLTLGLQSTTCFISTVVNIVFTPPIPQALLILAANIYMFIRVAAEAVEASKTDAGLAYASIILGLASFLFYIVSVVETVAG